jgi:uncharacterized protein YbjT (DUF2867 family)
MLSAGAGTRHCVGRVQRHQANGGHFVVQKLLNPSRSIQAPSRASVHLAGRVYASGDSKNVEPSDQRQKWDVGRFVKTLFFFTDPFRGLKKMFSGAEDGSRSSAAVSGDSWVLVVGATGGVGRRVVLELLKKGRKVRALVRDMDKAQKMYAGELAGNVMNFQLVPVDITQPRTLLPEYFAGVKQLVWCAATKIVPKEGDDVDRSKYYQGIKFYDPEVSGDTPEAVELRGMENVLAAIKAHGAIPLAGGLDVFHPSAGAGLAFGPIDDVVMGGVSQSTMSISPLGGEGGTSAGIFAGNVTQANNGGFASVRSKNFSPSMDVSGYDGFELRIKGDGQRYKFIARTEDSFDGVGYTCSFDTVPGAWHTIQIPFSGLIPVFRAKTITDGSKKPFIDVSDHLSSVQLMLSKFEYDGQLNPNWSEGAFELPIQYIKAYIKDPSLPCAVMVSSAGVTRWNRPGVDVEQEPPAVKMNEMLGGLLTYKLASEDALRDSGIGACIVRPCALTEEPNGMPVEFGQGDLLKGKISRDDVAELCVALLETPGMANVCFEIKSTVPFSKPWTAEDSEQSGDKGRSWPRVAQAAGLEAGVTGKTIDGVYTGGATGK